MQVEMLTMPAEPVAILLRCSEVPTAEQAELFRTAVREQWIRAGMKPPAVVVVGPGVEVEACTLSS